MYSSGVAFGPLIFYSNCWTSTSPLVKPAIILPIINSLTSLYAAFVLFSFLGHVSTKLNIPIKDLSQVIYLYTFYYYSFIYLIFILLFIYLIFILINKGGIDLAFIAYPGMLGMLSGANVWAVMFFVMLVLLGIDSIFSGLDYKIHFILD